MSLIKYKVIVAKVLNKDRRDIPLDEILKHGPPTIVPFATSSEFAIHLRDHLGFKLSDDNMKLLYVPENYAILESVAKKAVCVPAVMTVSEYKSIIGTVLRKDARDIPLDEILKLGPPTVVRFDTCASFANHLRYDLNFKLSDDNTTLLYVPENYAFLDAWKTATFTVTPFNSLAELPF